MGGRLCTLRNSGAAPLSDDDGDGDGYYDDETIKYSRSFRRKLKPSCLKIEKHKKMAYRHQESTAPKEESTTLEEWLHRSPSFEMMETSGSYSWRLSPKVCPLISTCCDESDGSPIQGAIVIGGDEPAGGRVVCLSRKRSSGSSRRVRFKLPEEADIHVIHTHYDSDECEV